MARGVLAVGPDPHEQLGGGAAHPAHTGRADPGQQAGREQVAVGDGAAHLDRDEQPRVPRQEPAVDDIRKRDLGIEQKRARGGRERRDEARLNSRNASSDVSAPARPSIDRRLAR